MLKIIARLFKSKNTEHLSLRDQLTPPKKMIFVGHGDFKKTGDEFLQYFIEKGGLKPDDQVLDVGAGIGRMALPLTEFLSEKGSYDGIDIVPKGIHWCSKKITPLFPKFQFHLADIYNQLYHPKGKQQASAYRFPFNDASFDFIFLTSVFTHMLTDDMENYLSEITRVLKPKGKCFITFFLLNEGSYSCIEKKLSMFNFEKQSGKCYYNIANKRPEDALAYKETYIRELFARYGLEINEPIHYGSWCGRKNYLSLQDIVIAEKK
jgi:ubiquinone/menaquinone biosynthesis C-methylase UbiE